MLHDMNMDFPVFLICFSCITAMLIVICIAIIFKNISFVTLNLSKGEYFVKSNIDGCKSTTILLVMITVLEFASGCVFRYAQVTNVSAVFDVSIREYILNLLFIALSYSAYKVFMKGCYYQNDSESVI